MAEAGHPLDHSLGRVPATSFGWRCGCPCAPNIVPMGHQYWLRMSIGIHQLRVIERHHEKKSVPIIRLPRVLTNALQSLLCTHVIEHAMDRVVALYPRLSGIALRSNPCLLSLELTAKP